MDAIADSGTGGDAPTPITGASTDREDEEAGMGLLADGRRRREPQTITRPVPALIRPAQTPTSGTLTRPWGVAGLPRALVAGPAECQRRHGDVAEGVEADRGQHGDLHGGTGHEVAGAVGNDIDTDGLNGGSTGDGDLTEGEL